LRKQLQFIPCHFIQFLFDEQIIVPQTQLTGTASIENL